jgi:radical SAM superfamily enzyme YgiQ (UPF0313 family)
MRILLVRPYPHKDTINSADLAVAEPLELEYLAAYAQNEGVESDIIDMLVDTRQRNITKILKTKKYDLAAFTGYMTSINIINALAGKVKKFDQNIVTIVGGIMAEVNPHVFNESSFDAVVKIDPLNTFREILKKMKRGERDFKTLNGVYDKNKTQYEFVRYLPEILPWREKTAQYRKFYRYTYLGSCATVRTSYGCPNRCNFCICRQASQGKYWERNLDEVIEEIKTLNADVIMITDDNFTANIKRVEMFCDLLERQNIKKKFFIQTTTHQIVKHEDTIRRLHKNGLFCTFLGVEAFEDGALKELNKRATAEQNRRALELLTELKIEISCGIICTPEWGKENFDNLKKNLIPFVPIIPMVNALVPMLGTPVYEVYKDKIAADEKRFEIFDMAHLIIKPYNMPPRKFYINVLKIYKNTTASKKMYDHIKTNYGEAELRCYKKSSRNILWQYIKLIIKNRV